MTDASPFSLKPKDALAYFRQKGLRPAFSYHDVWTEEHSKDFTVAKVLNVGLLQDYKDEIDKAIEGGAGFEPFKKAMLAHLKEHGMDGPVDVTDPITGKTVTVNLAATRRLKTVFSTNMRQAYNQGNWTRAWATRSILPYMIYHHNDVTYPRPEHVAWDGVCLPVDHPFWATHYPQCAWGCKCSTESVSRTILDGRGHKITPDDDIPVFPKKDKVNPRTGEVASVEQGIDPAFNYNVGKAPLRGLTSRPAAAGALKPRAEAFLEQPAQNFLKTFDAQAEGKIVTDRTGWPVAIGPDLFKDVNGGPATPRPNMIPDLPDVGKALKTYDKVEWRWGGANPVMDADQVKDIKAVLAELGKSGNSDAKARLNPVEAWLGSLARAQGVGIDGYVHGMDGGGVRHIFSEHGNPATEAARGQIAVTASDITAIPTIVASPDFVVFDIVDDQGLPAIGFVKTRDSDVISYVATILNKQRMLLSKTMRKDPATANALTVAGRLRQVQNVQNGGGSRGIIMELTGEIKKASRKSTLTRRYTKRLDNVIITVDFSGDGTWTYDVRPIDPS